jgi:hypothetical protein
MEKRFTEEEVILFLNRDSDLTQFAVDLQSLISDHYSLYEFNSTGITDIEEDSIEKNVMFKFYSERKMRYIQDEMQDINDRKKIVDTAIQAKEEIKLNDISEISNGIKESKLPNTKICKNCENVFEYHNTNTLLDHFCSRCKNTYPKLFLFETFKQFEYEEDKYKVIVQVLEYPNENESEVSLQNNLVTYEFDNVEEMVEWDNSRKINQKESI